MNVAIRKDLKNRFREAILEGQSMRKVSSSTTAASFQVRLTSLRQVSSSLTTSRNPKYFHDSSGGDVYRPRLGMTLSCDDRMGQSFLLPNRRLQSTATTATASASINDDSKKDNTSKDDSNKSKDNKKKDDSNIFLDNLGKIFLAAIASVILALVRGSYNTSTRATLRNQIEDDATLDPGEIDDLRIANAELTPGMFRDIMKECYATFPDRQKVTYDDFVSVVRRTMAKAKGEAFTVELGHMIDRVVVDILKKNDQMKSTHTEEVSTTENTAMPLSLWFAILSLALNSEVKDRIRILYEALEQESSVQSTSSSQYSAPDSSSDQDQSCNNVTIRQVQDMVDYLQASCQLPPDTQIVATERKYPVQEWIVGNSKDLVPWEGSQNDVIDLRTFATILRSKSVCAWGECYHRKNFDNEEV